MNKVSSSVPPATSQVREDATSSSSVLMGAFCLGMRRCDNKLPVKALLKTVAPIMKAIMEKIMDTALRCMYCPEPPGTNKKGDHDG